MKNERMFKSMIAKCLILAMSISLVPGNAWAGPRNSLMTKYQANATSSNADEFIGEEDEFIGEEDEPEITDDDIATDSNAIATGSDAKGEIPVGNQALLTYPVPYEEVTLDGREFTTVIPADEAPLYYVIKYTVPQGRGGYYSFGGDRHGGHNYYICNEEQYESLCYRIEREKGPVSATASVDCLETEYYTPVSYQLDAGQDYYFIAAWHKYYKYESNKLFLTREIDVTLYNSGTAIAGTPALYSKGGEWCLSKNRGWHEVKDRIVRPERVGYRFEGYYTAFNGQGAQVIDDFGNILPVMNELSSNCAVYAYWKTFSPISYQEIRLEGRTFSTTVSGGVSPYYNVFKFTVPEGKGGYYSFYKGYKYNSMGASGYLCTSEQYELLCHKIEQNKNAVWIQNSSDCLVYGGNHNFSINYNLEAGKDYYFISAGEDSRVDDYNVIFEREITVTLEAEGADQTGTAGIYSKFGEWLELGTTYYNLTHIKRPKKEGYKFSGYFTEKNGQGIKIIDYDGKILAELTALESDIALYAYWEEFTPVAYEEVTLVDGRFSTTGIAEQAPYYKVLKFKVPENGSGYYSFYGRGDDDIDLTGYLCTADQYVGLCRTIEAEGVAPSGNNQPGDYIDCNRYSIDMTRYLDGGQEYYFVTARRWKTSSEEGEYQILFRREIDVELDATEANYKGTRALYSKGDGWSWSTDRDWEYDYIKSPERGGYLFAGYFTGKNGQGKMIIDQDGDICHENIFELNDNTTVYALWENNKLEFRTVHLADGAIGVAYNQKLAVASKMNFSWWLIGELPDGLSLDSADGSIVGYPTETGTKNIVIIAYNSQIRIYKEFTITITELPYSGSDEEYPGTWEMGENGNWRYYSSGSNYYSNEWKYLEYNSMSHWYYFGSDGHVYTGWLVDNIGKWYYLNPVSNGTKGAMQTGWLTDPLDGNRYYLDPQTGQMITGWVNIDDIWYYFTESGGEYSGWKWDAAAETWQYEEIGRRPTGALEPDKRLDE